MAPNGRLQRIDPSGADTVFAPPAPGEGAWVGAPSVTKYDGRTFLAVRWRLPEERGYTVSVYERRNGGEYESVVELDAATVGAESLERPSLLTDPRTGRLKLYLSVEHGENDWTIQKLDDVTDPAAFDPSTARDVLEPAAGTTDAQTVKDPYVIAFKGRYYMYYAGHDGDREQAHLATSPDGERWSRSPANPVLESAGWHDFYTRISCVVPLPENAQWLVFYDGSNRSDYRAVRNLRTGFAVTDDLQTIADCSPNESELAVRTSDTRTNGSRFSTVRYLDVLRHSDAHEYFFEVARSDGAFELRRTVVDHENEEAETSARRDATDEGAETSKRRQATDEGVRTRRR